MMVQESAELRLREVAPLAAHGAGRWRCAPPLALLAASWLNLMCAPMCAPAAAGGYPPGTVAGFSAYDSVWWLVRDGQLVESGKRRDFFSITEGAAATGDGKILEVYSVPPADLPGGAEPRYGGIDVLSAEGAPERSWRFSQRSFNGVAVDEPGNVWVSDAASERLLRIDLETGSICRQLPLQTTERLQDIDARGYFYLLAPGGKGWVIRIRTPEGAYVRDISLGNGSDAPWVRIDPEGRLRAVVLLHPEFSSRLYTLLPSGEVLDAIEAPVNSTTFALTPNESAWFGFRDFRPPSVASLKEIGLDGTLREEIALPTGDLAGPGQLGYLDYIVAVPRAPRGSLCDELRCAPAKASPVGYPAGTVAAFSEDAGIHWLVREGELLGVGSRGAGFSSFDANVAATPQGKVVETYWAELFGPDRDGGNGTVGGIDLLSAEGVERRWLFQRHRFSGVAVDDSGNVWATTPDHLLRIDLADGLIKEQLPLSRIQPEFLQDIDGSGYFYLQASLGAGKGWVIRIRTPEGAHVRDIAIPGARPAAVRIDAEGRVLAWAGATLYTLLPTGQVLGAVEVAGFTGGFALTPTGTAWFGFVASEDLAPGLKEIARSGTVLQEILLPPMGEFAISRVVSIPPAPRGSLCDETTCPAATPTRTPTSLGGSSPTPSPEPAPSDRATDTPPSVGLPTGTPEAPPRTPTLEPTSDAGSRSSGCQMARAQRGGRGGRSFLLGFPLLLPLLRRCRAGRRPCARWVSLRSGQLRGDRLIPGHPQDPAGDDGGRAHRSALAATLGVERP